MDPFDIEGIDRAMADHESSGGLDGEAIVEAIVTRITDFVRAWLKA